MFVYRPSAIELPKVYKLRFLVFYMKYRWMIVTEQESLEKYIRGILEEKNVASKIYNQNDGREDSGLFRSLDCVIVDYYHEKCAKACGFFKKHTRAAIAVYPVDPVEEENYPLLVTLMQKERPELKDIVDYYIPISFTPESIGKLASKLKWRKLFRAPFYRLWGGK